MTIPSLSFLLAIYLVSAGFFLVPWLSARKGILAVLNLGFLALQIPNAPSWVALAAFLTSGYLVGEALRRRPGPGLLALYLTVLVAVFAALKRYSFLELILPPSILDHPVAVVGLSYMLFRQIHFLVDASQGQIDGLSPWTYLNYQINLFTLLSGPIQRYQDFAASWNELRPVARDRQDLVHAYYRLLWGTVKMVLIASVCQSLYERGLSEPSWGPVGRSAAVFYGYPAYVYFNFAGYCDVVIGAALLFGLRLPENFDRPYLARNMIDFWNRWHITLSHWLRDYLFTPLYKGVATRWPARALSMAPACYLIVFFIAGVWHGSSLNFAVFGVLHGLGVSGAKWWETYLVRRVGRKGLRRYMASRRITALATVVNLHFACATFLFFPPGLAHDLRIITTVFAGGRLP